MEKITSVLNLCVLFGVLITGIRSIHLGLVSPIEVVEEWGCHDTEIRLTCGQLDSKLAILEATFTPNCTHEDCLRMDVKRLVRTFASPQQRSHQDLRVAEKEAGRKFLETLRRKHPDREDEDLDEEGETHDAEEDGGENDDDDDFGRVSSTMGPGGTVESSSSNPSADRLIGLKKRRTSLRTTLEKLIIRYLRKLSPGEEFEAQQRRSGRRSRRELARLELGARNITINETEAGAAGEATSAEELRRIQETRSFCPEQTRKITSLDRFDLERSYRNESEEEYNIRRLLVKRCSGKNHCSFIFAIDHPFSKVWESGVVRVKYICMDDFRVNRYCGEHLNIGYEIDPKVQLLETTKGEPVAHARRQSRRETALHSLKILRNGGDNGNIEQLAHDTAASSSNESRKRKIKVQQAAVEQSAQDVVGKSKERSGVYSQDFRVLKILPSNINDFNDIEQIGDEIYFRKDTDILNEDESPPSATTTSTTTSTTTTTPTTPDADESNLVVVYPSVVVPSPPSGYASDVFEASVPEVLSTPPALPSPLTPIDFSKFENITIVISEGEQIVIAFPKSTVATEIADNLSRPDDYVMGRTSTVTTRTTTTTTTTTATATTSSTSTSTSIENTTKSLEMIENDIELAESSLGGTISSYDDDDDEEDIDEDIDSDDDIIYSDETFDRRTYNSVQRTSFRSPLLHGFAMTPGYPKFYIGDSDCKWVIMAPDGLKIRLSILDLSLRYEDNCMDYLRIVDLNGNRTMFNSCTEAIRPLEVISDSNRIVVIVKTTTKFAYPKRGVLIHYSAVGCVNPPLPLHGKLIERTETTASYECSPSFVFPDTGNSKRQIVCNERDIWDKVVPDCIEEEYIVSRSGFVSDIELILHKKPPDGITTTHGRTTDLSSSNMPEKDADMVYDIIIPTLLIAGLFIVNGVIFSVIMKYRRRHTLAGDNSVELAEL